MTSRTIFLALAALSLAGCDAAIQMAGDAVEGEVRNTVAAQCEQVSANAGIAAAQVAEVCQCSADTFLADPNLTLGDVTPEKLEGIVNACAASTGAANGNSTGTTPTEANNEW